jgi:hypothetical protein
MVEFSRFQRGVWGVIGGIVAVTTKFVGQDIYWLRVLSDTRAADQVHGMIVFYIVLAVVLGFLGIVFAIASRENTEMKLLAIAISAPALVTTYMGGAKAEIPAVSNKAVSEYISPISTAQAADSDSAGSKVSSSGFWNGFLLPLGYGKDEQRYRVVVGSFKDETAAAKKAEQINKIDPTLKASVGDKRIFNDFYPVVVGDYAAYPQARALKEKVSEKLDTDDVYLTPYKFP